MDLLVPLAIEFQKLHAQLSVINVHFINDNEYRLFVTGFQIFS